MKYVIFVKYKNVKNCELYLTVNGHNFTTRDNFKSWYIVLNTYN